MLYTFCFTRQEGKSPEARAIYSSDVQSKYQGLKMGWGYFGFFKLHWVDLGGQKDWIKEIGFSHITYLNFRELLGVFDKVRV